MPDLGVRLQLFLGPTLPLPAPFEVIDALRELQVTNNDRERDGFQMKFALGKQSLLDYDLLLKGYFDPPARVVVMAIFGALPQMLIDGVVTSHQVLPSNKPGESSLIVTGEDVSLMLDLEEKSETYPNQPDSVIVTRILLNYASLGLIPQVTPTSEVPIQTDRIPNQQDTDLGHIQFLARRNGFVFYLEPAAPGVNTAYWGLDNRLGLPQPALSMNLGPDTNVDTPINFNFNALGPATPQVSILDPLTGLTFDVPVPNLTHPPLVSRPASSLRKTRARDTANLNPIQAGLRALASASETADAVTATGELDAARYARALQSRRLVGVRGVGASYDGLWYVKQVTHRIKRGEYRQSFTLIREGRGALTPVVVP